MKARVIVLVFINILYLCVVSARPVEAAENSWTTKQPMPKARSALGVAVVDGKIYVIGGSWLNTTEMYDPVTDTWTAKTPMPTARSYFGIAVYQNKIYVIGGQVGAQDPTGVNEVYDPFTDTWETKTSMPTSRKYLSANVVNGKIYLIGGCQYVPQSTNLNVNEVYDPANDSWTTRHPIPTGVEGYASAVVDNRIYIIEGMNSSLNQIYDPKTDTWSFGKQSPAALNFAVAGATTGVAAPKRIYVIGGYPMQGMGASSSMVRVYDPEEDAWAEGTSMPTPRYSLGVAVVNDVLYAIGGGTGWFTPETAQNEQYTPFGYVAVSQQPERFPALLIVAASVVAIVAGSAGLLWFYRKRLRGAAKE